MRSRKPHDRIHQLPGGRWLGYAEYGAADGRPLFYFHGWPGSRIEARVLDKPARELGVRVIAVDRPGYGISDFQPGRRILDWPRDVQRLADALGLDRFSAVGLSGGGPYAAVCAFALSDRLASVGIVSGMGPLGEPEAVQGMASLNRRLLGLAQNWPRVSRLVFRPIAGLIRMRPSIVALRLLASSIPEADRRALHDDEVRRALTDTMGEAFRQGAAGAMGDGQLYAEPWGFRLEEIPMVVDLWHGELDVNVPAAMGRLVSQRIPRCRARFHARDGHFSLPWRRGPEIMRALVEGWGS